MRNGGPERSGHLLKITELMRGEAGLERGSVSKKSSGLGLLSMSGLEPTWLRTSFLLLGRGAGAAVGGGGGARR